MKPKNRGPVDYEVNDDSKPSERTGLTAVESVLCVVAVICTVLAILIRWG